jgi:hypothetical protein
MKWTRLALLMSMLASLSGCATSRPAGDFCDVASPIRPSRQDVLTDGTKVQLLKYLEYGAKACGWK